MKNWKPLSNRVFRRNLVILFVFLILLDESFNRTLDAKSLKINKKTLNFKFCIQNR